MGSGVGGGVVSGKLDLLQLCFSLNFCFLMFFHLPFPSMLFFLVLPLNHPTLICFSSKILKVKTIKKVVYL